MPPARAAERLAAVRSEVDRACRLLVAPSQDNLDHCQSALQRATTEFAGCRFDPQQDGGDAELLSQARRLRADVLRAAKLLENIAAFCLGWDRILGAMSAGYVSGGSAAPVLRQSRLCCRG